MSPHEALTGYKARPATVPVPDVASALAVNVTQWHALCAALRERVAVTDASTAYSERARIERGLEAPTAYKVGDLVLVHGGDRQSKWHSPFIGLYVVTRG